MGANFNQVAAATIIGTSAVAAPAMAQGVQSAESTDLVQLSEKCEAVFKVRNTYREEINAGRADDASRTAAIFGLYSSKEFRSQEYFFISYLKANFPHLLKNKSAKIFTYSYMVVDSPEYKSLELKVSQNPLVQLFEIEGVVFILSNDPEFTPETQNRDKVENANYGQSTVEEINEYFFNNWWKSPIATTRAACYMNTLEKNEIDTKDKAIYELPADSNQYRVNTQTGYLDLVNPNNPEGPAPISYPIGTYNVAQFGDKIYLIADVGPGLDGAEIIENGFGQMGVVNYGKFDTSYLKTFN